MAKKKCEDPTHERRTRTKKRSSTGATYEYIECATCVRAYDADPARVAARRVSTAAYREANKEQVNEKGRAWHAANKEHDAEVRRNRLASDPEVMRTYLDKAANSTRARRAELRRQIFAHYGTACACCGLAVFELLTIDHIEARGGASTGKNRTGHKQYLDLIRAGYPDGYQTLCYSCNSGKSGHRSVCPHQELPPKGNYVAEWRKRVKAEAFSRYGDGTCCCCGESNPYLLTLHHVNGDGQEHRTLLSGRSQSWIYSALKSSGWPTDPPLEVRCLSCNWGADMPGGCPCGRSAD